MGTGLKRGYIAGHFNVAFSASSYGSSAGATWSTFGSTRDGFRLKPILHEQEVHDDAFGDGVADTIQQGVDYQLEGIAIEYAKLSSSNAMWSQIGVEGLNNQNVGHRGSDLYGSLCLTPVAGTPAATQIGAGNSYLFYLCAIINDPEVLLSAKLREVPVTFRCLPDPNSEASSPVPPAPDGTVPGASMINVVYAIVATSSVGTLPTVY